MASTGPFPGAPINTDPVNTQANSMTEPVTSPSTASTVPPGHGQGQGPSSLPQGPGPTIQVQGPSSQAPPSSITSLPGPLSTGPRSTAAPDDARAASSASNPTDRPPGSVDPSTSATSTSGTATTTTATSTKTSAGASTSTTTTTTTVPARVMSPVPTQQMLKDTFTRCNNCLFLVRKLRNKQNTLTDVFLKNDVPVHSEDCGKIEQLHMFTTVMQEMNIIFDKLDQSSKRLPKVVPAIDNLNNMRTLYMQEHTMNHTNMSCLVDKMIDRGNWNEGNYQGFYYLAELLRITENKRKQFENNTRKTLPPVRLQCVISHGHIQFETAYNAMRREITKQNLGIYAKTIHRTMCSLVVEFRFGSAGRMTHEEDVIIVMKFLLVEKGGRIDYINMIAPHEDWTIRNDFGKKLIDVLAPSRCEIYKRLTKQANHHLNAFFGNSPPRWSASNLLQFVSLFGKFREVQSTKCRACHKILKDFLPPMIFDIRTPNVAFHETCRLI
ncbi:unnamed protein product [Caenorhabditis sp. 36 PRJEB53466]|nr:unnamed protein product [Caenorhabditis sp. 36 PRJEB53466]